MFECQGKGGVGVYKNGKKILQIQNWMLSTPNMYVKSMIPWHLCLSVGGGVLGGVYKNGEKILQIQNNVEHPQHLSHIHDKLTFMFECQGWGVGGSIKNGKKILQIQNWMLSPPNI